MGMENEMTTHNVHGITFDVEFDGFPDQASRDGAEAKVIKELDGLHEITALLLKGVGNRYGNLSTLASRVVHEVTKDLPDPNAASITISVREG